MTVAGYISTSQQARDHSGLRATCTACGHDGTTADPLVKTLDGSRIHHSHTTDPRSGFYGQAQKG
jgi:hypothetical protein